MSSAKTWSKAPSEAVCDIATSAESALVSYRVSSTSSPVSSQCGSRESKVYKYDGSTWSPAISQGYVTKIATYLDGEPWIATLGLGL
jgi:hypothetical protein